LRHTERRPGNRQGDSRQVMGTEGQTGCSQTEIQSAEAHVDVIGGIVQIYSTDKHTGKAVAGRKAEDGAAETGARQTGN
jgi:hypothetical protein